MLFYPPMVSSELITIHTRSLIRRSSGFTSTPTAIAGCPVVTGQFLSRTSIDPCLGGMFPRLAVLLGFQRFQRDNVTATLANPTIADGPGIPFDISFIGMEFSAFKLISYAFAYEQKTHNRLKRLAFPAAIPKTQLTDVIESN
jgi:amidase